MPWLPGEALADHLGPGIDEDRHQAALRTAATILRAASAKIVGRDDGKPRTRKDLLTEVHVGPFQSDHERHGKVDLAGRGDDALGDDVAPHYAAEDVDEDAFHVGVGKEELKGGG